MKPALPLFLLFLVAQIGLGQNLILNSDFESNGQLKCDSWYDACQQELVYLCDTLLPGNPCDVRFEQDAPPGDGIWSIAITGVGNSPASTASTYITGQQGTNHYRLEAWMKDTGAGWGGINIGTHHKGVYELKNFLRADSLDWAFFTVDDTLSLEPEDSIEITLWAFAAGPSFGDIYFDQVEFIRLDTLSSGIHPLPDQEHPVIVFPNPSTQYVTFRVDDLAENHTLSIARITGEPALSMTTRDQIFTVDLANWGSGVYVYAVTRTNSGTKIGQGICLIR